MESKTASPSSKSYIIPKDAKPLKLWKVSFKASVKESSIAFFLKPQTLPKLPDYFKLMSKHFCRCSYTLISKEHAQFDVYLYQEDQQFLNGITFTQGNYDITAGFVDEFAPGIHSILTMKFVNEVPSRC